MSATNISSQLENALKRSTDAIRLVLIAYLNSQEIPITSLRDYVGSGPYIHGAKGISVNKQLNIASLKLHFIKDIPLAKRCFEETLLSKYIVRLKDECVQGIENSIILSTLTKLSSALDSLGVGRHQLSIINEKISDILGPGLETDFFRMLSYLAVLFPAIIKVECRGIDTHSFLVTKFDEVKLRVPEGKKLDAAEFFIAAFTSICPHINEASVILSSPIIKFKVKLEVLYAAFEYAYWSYIAKRYRNQGILSRFTTLQDLLPIINEELKKMGYLRALTLREVFEALKRIELESLEEGKIWFRIVGSFLPRESEPIPIEFYAPRQLSLEELKELGVPVSLDEAKRLWKF
jgi:hypothetical protein